MWTCSKCGEKHEDHFDSCWKCDHTRAGATVVATTQQEARHPLSCVRCATSLDYVGTKRFHEGTRWGVLGELGELLVNRESFDVFLCPRCGRVEFFVEDIGEERVVDGHPMFGVASGGVFFAMADAEQVRGAL
jgi:predicted nucleic-acid-binding Zn-ribbon protein